MTTLVMKHRSPTTVLRKRGIQIKKPALSPDKKPSLKKSDLADSKESIEKIDRVTKVVLMSTFVIACSTLLLVFISLLI